MEKIKTKICSHCKKELDINCFYKRRTSKDGLYIYCKICSSEIYQINKKKKEGKKNESC